MSKRIVAPFNWQGVARWATQPCDQS